MPYVFLVLMAPVLAYFFHRLLFTDIRTLPLFGKEDKLKQQSAAINSDGLRVLTPEALKLHDGTHEGVPVYICIAGKV